jgi:3-deoxy-D-manno-octulosonic-acid transferase
VRSGRSTPEVYDRRYVAISNGPIIPERGRPSGTALRLYDLATAAVVGALLDPLERWARLKGRARAADRSERRGETRWLAPAAGPRILVHAVSVGEMRAAAALAHALAAESPRVELFLTAGNRDGRAAAERVAAALPAVRGVQLLPWDHRGTLRPWLAALRPDVVAVVEMEIWPALWSVCRELEVPLVLVSGRLGRRNAIGYSLIRPFIGGVLRGARCLAAQTEADRQRFVRLGATPSCVRVMGDLKSDLPPLDPASVPPIPSTDPERPTLVAGSTHAPEERWLLDALASLLARRGAQPRPRLVLAPRRIARATEVARLARERGLMHRLSSELDERKNRSDWDVLILDVLGPLASLYPGAAIAFVGGTLARWGGHTPLEAAACGVPLLAGPSCSTIAAHAERLERAGGLVRIGSKDDLAGCWESLLDDAPRRARMRHALLEEAARTRGVARGYALAVLAGGPEIVEGDTAPKHAATSARP